MATNIVLNNRIFRHRYNNFSLEEFKKVAKYWLDRDTLEIHAILSIDAEVKQTKVWVTLHLSNNTTVDLRLPGYYNFSGTIDQISENFSSALPIYEYVDGIDMDLANHKLTLTEQQTKYQHNLENKTQELAVFTSKYGKYAEINAEYLL